MALPCDAWLNIEADNLAKTKVNLTHHRSDQYYLPGEGWACSIGSQWIVKQLASTIHLYVTGIPAEKNWKTKFRLSETLWSSIE